MLEIGKNLREISNTKKEMAASQEAQRINAACKADFEKRAEALSSWNGLGNTPVAIPYHYIYTPSKSTVMAAYFGGKDMVIDVVEGVPLREFVAALKANGWESFQESGEECFVLV